MNISALAGTAIGSAAVGTLAAGWLVMLTPLPVYVARPAEAAAPMRFASVADARPASPPAVVRASVAATSRLASAPSPQPPRTVARPPMPSGLSSRPMSARAAGVAFVKRHLAKVAMILPSMHPPDGASQPHAAAKPRLAGALTPSEINRLRVSLRLSPEQEAQWSPVAGILRQLARRQMAALKNGEEPSLGSTSDLMHFYSTAQPLLRNLREDQKVEVRALARRMGFGSFASYI